MRQYADNLFIWLALSVISLVYNHLVYTLAYSHTGALSGTEIGNTFVRGKVLVRKILAQPG